MQEISHLGLFAGAYFAVLIGHFAYAAYLIYVRKVSLAAGSVTQPWLILTLLLVINGFSMTVYLWPNRHWTGVNVVYHVILAADEVYRTKKVPSRWPFILNHVLFAGAVSGTML